MHKFFLLFALVFTTSLWGQQTEILIIGTMHNLNPKHTENYSKLLEQIRPWNPTVICSEYRKPTDTVSLNAVYGEDIFAFQDSLAQAWQIDLKTLPAKIKAAVAQVQKADNLENRLELAKLYHLNQDRGNAYFQYYHICNFYHQLDKDQQKQLITQEPYLERVLRQEENSQYGEYWLMAFPLALEQQIGYLYPTDDQTDREAYHEAWGKANEEIAGHPLEKDFKALRDSLMMFEKQHIKKGTAAITFNQYQLQEMLYRLECDFYPSGLSASSDLRNYYWIKRNERMAKHILQVAEKHPNERIVVFYGCSHVPAIRRQLKALSDHRILTLPDLTKK